MRFVETDIPGAYVVELQRIADERGFFARAWCARELEEHGLTARCAQANVGFSDRRGTLRGLHFQAAPSEEAKLVRCTRGAAFDVVVDARPGSPAFGRWAGFELTADNGRMVYVPEGCAHGYLTLVDATEVFYQSSAFYDAAAVRGVHYADPVVGIRWPAEVVVVSAQDEAWPGLEAARSTEAGR